MLLVLLLVKYVELIKNALESLELELYVLVVFRQSHDLKELRFLRRQDLVLDI